MFPRGVSVEDQGSPGQNAGTAKSRLQVLIEEESEIIVWSSIKTAGLAKFLRKDKDVPR